jgi:hypothetical protein
VVTFDRLTQVTRQSAAVQAGPMLLARLIETLRELWSSAADGDAAQGRAPPSRPAGVVDGS